MKIDKIKMESTPASEEKKATQEEAKEEQKQPDVKNVSTDN